MVEWEKREEKKEEQKEMRHRQEMREHEADQAREAERERGRERGLAGPRQLGRMPSGRGNTPIVLSRPRVLAGLYQTLHEKLALVTGNAPVTDQVLQISQEK
jgi:hypothetical protein